MCMTVHRLIKIEIEVRGGIDGEMETARDPMLSKV